MQSQRMSRFVKSFDSKKFRQRDIDLRDILDILTCFLICNKFYLIQIRGVDVFLENLFTCTICEKVSFCFISKPLFHFLDTSLLSVDGGYSQWSSYSACSKTCGDGLKKRTRSCTNPSPAHGGKQCQGASEEEAECKVRECPGEHFEPLYLIWFPFSVKHSFS